METAALLGGVQGGRLVSAGLVQVVHRGVADMHRREVLLDPLRDVGAAARRVSVRAMPVARDEVADLAAGHVLLELRERRRVVGTGEPADRHQRSTGLEFEAAHRERADTGCRPTIVRVLDELLKCRVVGLGARPTSAAAEAAIGATWATLAARPAAEPAFTGRTGHRSRATVRDVVERKRGRRAQPEECRRNRHYRGE